MGFLEEFAIDFQYFKIWSLQSSRDLALILMYILCYISKQVQLFQSWVGNEEFEASEDFYFPTKEILFFPFLLRIDSKKTEIGMY